MGEKLKKFYDEADKLGGTKAKMRLAMITLISSNDAPSAEDSSENVTKFENAMKEIKKEFE
jgi:hypothetical protein